MMFVQFVLLNLCPLLRCLSSVMTSWTIFVFPALTLLFQEALLLIRFVMEFYFCIIFVLVGLATGKWIRSWQKFLMDLPQWYYHVAWWGFIKGPANHFYSQNEISREPDAPIDESFFMLEEVWDIYVWRTLRKRDVSLICAVLWLQGWHDS